MTWVLSPYTRLFFPAGGRGSWEFEWLVPGRASKSRPTRSTLSRPRRKDEKGKISTQLLREEQSTILLAKPARRYLPSGVQAPDISRCGSRTHATRGAPQICDMRRAAHPCGALSQRSLIGLFRNLASA